MQRILYLLLCLTCSVLARAQSYECRYWFDGDYANAKTASVTGTLRISADVSGLAEGIHAVHFQAQDAECVMSSPQTRYFVKTAVMGRNFLRYWFDDNIKDAKTLPAAAVMDIDADVAGLSETVHVLHIQETDENGVGSTPVSQLFLRTPIASQTKIRYWFDDDVSNGAEVKGNGLTADIDVSSLPDGIHKLSTMATGNSPSAVQNTYFLKIPQVIGVDSLKCVSYVDGEIYMQKYVEANGGIMHYDLDVASLPEGIHSLQVQVYMPSGAVSEMASAFFLRSTTAAELSAMKCYYAIDETFEGKEVTSIGNGGFMADLDVENLTYGKHKIAFIMVNSAGKAISIHSAEFEKTVKKGDVDHDYMITMSDANAVVNWYLGNVSGTESFDMEAADVDEDGAITMSDANGMVNMYLGDE